MGHPISSDNGLISQILLLKAEFYYTLYVAMGVAYSCLKYGVFITTYLMLYKVVNNTVRAHGREKSHFKLFFAGGRVSLRCSMFLWKVILVLGDVV